MVLVIGSQLHLANGDLLQSLRQGPLANLHVIFFSIIIEALPFVIIGVLGSTILEVFVSPDTIQRLLPRTWFLGILASGSLGLLFPFCECGLVPIARRLMEKGVPAPLAAVFLLAAPVVNPVVGLATHFAFLQQPEFVWWRLGGAYVLAVVVGFILVASWSGTAPVKPGGLVCGCGLPHDYAWDNTWQRKVANAVYHSQEEFFSITYYLIIGAFLAAAAQVYLPRIWLTMAGSHETGSVAVMMAVAFFLSLCSGADAFVANTFAGSFTPGAVVAFMVYGPMVDLKNLLMMLAAFKAGFVLRLTLWVTLLAFLLGLIINKAVVMAA